ncbi:MAG TPA: protein kinase [Myxococcaceae bacterium]|nr:protein kinase [Myxococcaceae bacterium]
MRSNNARVEVPEDPYFDSVTEASPERRDDGASGPENSARGPSRALEPGTRIGQYELIRELGSGGMGTVFLARDTRLGRRVAIKFLHTEGEHLVQRFLLEAQTTARCSHENIVIIHDVGVFQDSPFMVLEFLEGEALSKLLHRQRLSPARAVELMVPVIRALACAHEQNIVHRDLKPENVVVTDSGAIKVLDFGIAKVLQGDKPLPALNEERHALAPVDSGGSIPNITHAGTLVGTMAYMSPEQWGSGEEVDHRTDIWAAGIMLFRMLAGRHPLEPLSGSQLVVTGLLDEPMPLLGETAPEVPKELASVVDRCLRKRREERFQDALSLARALEPFLPGRLGRELRIEDGPYAGLSSFQESDADRFFGRSREIASVVNRLRDQPLVAVAGPSGAGKSSFVRAGLVPQLKRSGESWEAFVLRPGRHPLAALASLMSPMVSSSPSVEEDVEAQRKLVQRLRDEPGYVGSMLRSRARREGRQVLLFIDQFEELYTQVSDVAERQAFTACLSSVADDATSPTRVIVSLRSDFLDRVSENERFMAELSQGLVFLGPPNREGLQDALVQPAEMAGYRFETPRMVEHMLEHLGATQGALPLLQFAATRLWDAREPARKLLTEAAYEAMGGITGALANHADSVLEKLSAAERVVARDILQHLVTPERTRALLPLEELRCLSKDPQLVQRLVDHLVQARLLVIHTVSGGDGASVELVHESLLHAWPTLRRWLEEGQEDAGFLEQLRQAARQWQAKGRHRDLLWHGELVEEARRFQRRYRGELPEAQRAFLDAVFSQAERATRRKRVILASAVSFLILLVAASAVALVVIRNAQQEAEHRAVEARRAVEAERVAAEEARRAEEAARVAKEEAQRNLAEVQAQKLALKEALQQVNAHQTNLAAKNEELERVNARLIDAVAKATRAEERARKALRTAEFRAEEARQAKKAADRLRREAEKRANELAEQLKKFITEMR